MRRLLRQAGRFGLYLVRPRNIAVLVLFAVPSWIALAYARGVSQYGGNLALNLGAEFIGSFIVLVAFSPMLRRAARGQVLEHRRMNFDWYVDRVAAATGRVRVMHTFTRLFERPYDDRFFGYGRALLDRGGAMQVLLLAPDSAAARHRTEALGGRVNVAAMVRANLNALSRFRDQLPPESRERMDVRLYRTSAAVTLYQWDDRALISFLPLGGLSGDTVQLETSIESNLGDFALGQFEDLWEAAIPLDAYLIATLVVGSSARELPYVQVDDVVYVVDELLEAECLGGSPRLAGSVARFRDVDSFRTEVVFADHTKTQLRTLCRDKYDRDGSAFVQLIPTQRNAVP